MPYRHGVRLGGMPARRVDMLNFQINEIAAAKLKPDEDKTLLAERTRLLEALQTGDNRRLSLRLIGALGREGYLDYARRHAEVIERFGRFPHRNAVLGRMSTPEEIEFLKQPGSGF